MMGKSVLQISDLSFGFMNSITSDVNLSIGKNRFITVMGENGCGKTTLIDCLMGVHQPFGGHILFWGEEYSGSNVEAINKKVGWVISQRENYPLHLSVEQYLNVVSAAYDSWDEELCSKLCLDFDLDGQKKLRHLSMGENSKVRLIKALSFRPSLIVLDELTANLSPQSKTVLIQALLDLFSEGEMSVLYICHSNEEAIMLSDEIYVLTKSGLSLKEEKK